MANTNSRPHRSGYAGVPVHRMTAGVAASRPRITSRTTILPTPFTRVRVVASSIAVWLVGLLSMAALFTASESLPVMSLLLPWSVFAALLIATLAWRGGWSRAADVGQTAGATPARQDDSERLDEELDQSFPASDPPSFTSGIARVQSAQ